MARSHAKILTAIWDDPDWVSLTAGAQRVYKLLISQKKLTLVGLLTYTPSRWARLAADTTLDSVERDIHELEASRFVLVDRDTDELLIRTLVKNDVANTRLLDNRNLLRGLWNAWEAIESRLLRVEAVHAMPDVLFETDRCQPHPDALQVRSSPRLEREVPTTSPDLPFGRGVETSLSPFALPDVEFSAANQADLESPRGGPLAAAVDKSQARLSDKERQQRLAAAVDLLVEREIQRNPTRGPSPDRHRNGVRRGKLADHHQEGHRLLSQQPDLTAEALANLLEPPTEPSANGERTASGERINHTHDEYQRAQRQRHEANTANVVELHRQPADQGLNLHGIEASRAILGPPQGDQTA